MLQQLFTTPVPTAVAMGIGAVGLALGAAFTAFATRDRIAQARRLMKIAMRYEQTADTTYANIRALTEPTGAVPIVELFPPTRAERVRQAIGDAVNRVTARTDRAPADWAEGELRRIIEQVQSEQTATPYQQEPDPTPQVVACAPPVAEPYRIYQPVEIQGEAARDRFSTRTARLRQTPTTQRAMPTQRRGPSPLLMAALPDDPSRQWRVKVLDRI